MKPIDRVDFEQTIMPKENLFQETRRRELKEFIESGAEIAELQISGSVTLNRERECYKKALRQIWKFLKEYELTSYDVKFHTKKGKLYVEKKTAKGET